MPHGYIFYSMCDAITDLPVLSWDSYDFESIQDSVNIIREKSITVRATQHMHALIITSTL